VARPFFPKITDWVAALAVVLLAGVVLAAEHSPAPREIRLREGLVIPSVGSFGRSPIHPDALEALRVAGTWTPPRAGELVKLPDGSARKWEAITANKDGAFTQPALRGGYAYFAVPAEEAGVMLLEAGGHTMVYVNGLPRGGDPYDYGYVRLPILLEKGTNHLLFHVNRDPLHAKLTSPQSTALLNLHDLTLPDLLVGEAVDTEAAAVVLNATRVYQENLVLEATLPGGQPERTPLPTLSFLSARKLGFRLKGAAPSAPESCKVHLRLLQEKVNQWQTLDTADIQLRIRRPDQTHKRTFRSAIDGSVQYYAVVPPRLVPGDHSKPGLVLTLHGAAVEALGQAESYAPLPWAYIVAPTNRRPYGFDWEDWGRLDALEVLELAQKRLDTDPQRTYLTGHSMGGHGTWHLGVTYPGRFAAIGPSAGWVSMWSYAGMRRPEHAALVQELFLRSAATSDTLALSRNLANLGVYVLHGDKDDNVPVQQARIMKERLSAFHKDFQYHEEPGMGHWWGKNGIPGAACVTWPPMFDFFARHKLPEAGSVHQVDFITVNPGVSATLHWATIEAQTQALRPSLVSLHYDPDQRRFSGTTVNVARLTLDLHHVPPEKPIAVELDGQKVEPIAWPTAEPRLWLSRQEGKWSAISRPSAALKGPHRSGPFKDAFRNRMVFVYGTKGTPEECEWALTRARFDAEVFGYRGNGSVDVIADTAYSATGTRGRNVILYGNADSNGAWKSLLADSPVQVHSGQVRVGDHTEKGTDLACVFLRPRPGEERAAVGVVSGTGVAGMRLTDSWPYFISGVGYPDCVVAGPEALTRGLAGVRMAGFFGQDWGVAGGEFVWRK
jgi:predicted esterase